MVCSSGKQTINVGTFLVFGEIVNKYVVSTFGFVGLHIPDTTNKVSVDAFYAYLENGIDFGQVYLNFVDF